MFGGVSGTGSMTREKRAMMIENKFGQPVNQCTRWKEAEEFSKLKPAVRTCFRRQCRRGDRARRAVYRLLFGKP